ncbi:H/ACA snoRNP pseudouridylase subunit [Neophaeococcomyces mojaviensis]|uniref:H/ACA snoRNP pseudouridylase subunit n=1 Tax=Neophaeococcomyces mojaviensis TaxID=3383035 RepID=A0ACC3AHE3_9EURO|nr:H/ACA snoRNP pseudouridylase subunit [Knufia sp. JES_112]
MADITFTLNTGAKIPAVGLGTWQSAPGEVKAAVAHAIKVGYRHIDCAYCYANEDEVGAGIQEGLKATGLQRSDLFITTKLWCTYHTRVEQNLDMSLKSLGLDYVDLYLMHWPVAMNPEGNHEKFPKKPDGSRDLILERKPVDTYKDMEKLLQTGKVKAIGVSNFSKKFLEQLLPQVSVVPAANQIENHPLLPQQEVVDYCKEKGILVEAYSPLGSTGSPLMKDKNVVKVAEETGASPGTILLSYHVARGVVPLPKSVTPSRIEENFKIVKLSAEQLSALEDISKSGTTRFVYPEFGINFGFPDKDYGTVASAA